MTLSRIPIFPLEVVLFPLLPLPLHIFEPRYKLMIRECLEARSEFGVVLAREKGIAPVGCTAEIIKVVKKYPDGRMDILTGGQTVFRIENVHDEKAYLEADVEFLEDSAELPSSADLASLVKLFDECHTLIYGRAAAVPDPASGASTTYFIAHEMPFELDFKQALLEVRSESQRVEILRGQLEKLLPELQKIAKLRKKVGGNGHGRN